MIISNNYKNILNGIELKFLSFIYFSIPVFLISGPFFSDLSLITIDLFFLFYIVFKKEYNFLNNFFFKFFLIFYFLLLISAFFSTNQSMSLLKTIPYIRFGIFFLAISFLLKKNNSKIFVFFSKIYKLLIIIFIFLLIDSLFQSYLHFNIIGIPIDDTKRVSSFFGNELIMGSFIFRFYIIMIAISYFLNKKKKYFIFISMISFILVVLSGERTSFFLFILFNLILFFKFQLFKNKFNLLLILVCTIAASFISFNNYSYDRLVNKTIHQFKNQDNKIVFFTPTHHALYKTSINIYKDYPLFGSGLKTFRLKCDSDKYKVSELGCSTHPHNIYLTILSETGILVFSFFLIFYSYIIFFLLKNWFKELLSPHDKLEYILYLFLFINFFPLAPSGSFFNNWLSIIFYYPIGIIVWLKFLKKNEKINY